jgi:hypothetical protein
MKIVHAPMILAVPLFLMAGCGGSGRPPGKPICGNRVIEEGETCDPPSTCPTGCDDEDPCTTDSLEGSADRCNARCSHLTITKCLTGDGCCPDGCTWEVDRECTEPPQDTLLGNRGVAGSEVLFSLAAGKEVLLADGKGEPNCGGKIYCDYPPTPIWSRFLFYDLVGPDKAVLLEDPGTGPAAMTIDAVDLSTAKRTRLSANVPWVDVGECCRPGWVYAYARQGETTYWSLRTQNGMELFVGTEGAPLRSIRKFPVPANEDAIQSWLSVQPGVISWSMELINASNPYLRVFLMDEEGEDLASFDGEFSELCTPGIAVGNTFLAQYLPPGTPLGACETLVIDLATRKKRKLNGTQSSHFEPWSISAAGDRVAEVDGEKHLVNIYRIDQADPIATVPGDTAVFSPSDSQILVVQDFVGFRLVLHNLRDGTETVLWDGGTEQLGFTSYVEPPGQLFSPDGDWLATATGAPFSDLTENVGLSVISLKDLHRIDLSLPSTSESFFRHFRFTRDSRFLIFLDTPGEELLDIAALELSTGKKIDLTPTDLPERGFVLGHDFTPVVP